MKRLPFLFLFLAILTFLVACKATSERTTHSFAPILNNNTANTQNPNTVDVYSNMAYTVGKDIPEGTYAIQCTKSDYGMDIVIFASSKEYSDFQAAEKYTNGEYKRAKELYAWASFYVNESEYVYTRLKNGNVVLLNDGMCEFNSCDITTSNILYPGVYVVDEDIPTGNLIISSISNGLSVTAFETKSTYTNYHQADRYTYGDELDAKEQYSYSNTYVYTGNSTTVSLSRGMILLIDGGSGEFIVDSGPIIN